MKKLLTTILLLGALAFPAYGQMRGADGKPMWQPQQRDTWEDKRGPYNWCGKSWHKKLPAEGTPERKWFEERRVSIFGERDLDGDGSLDTIILSSHPAMAPDNRRCDMKPEWYDKTSRITVIYNNGKQQWFPLKGLVHSYKLELNTGGGGRIITNGWVYSPPRFPGDDNVFEERVLPYTKTFVLKRHSGVTE